MYRIEAVIRIGWAPDGIGGAGLVQSQANIPGSGSGLTPATGFLAQVLQLQQGEPVVAVNPDAPTQTEFRTAITQAATDLNTQITSAVTSTLQGYASGSP